MLVGLAVSSAVVAVLPTSTATRNQPAADTAPQVHAQRVARPPGITPRTPKRVPHRASRGGVRTVRYVQKTVAVGPTFSGEASWYGLDFQGRRTASGETFNTYAMTAASKTLPFGTVLQVCRQGRCVLVRINDRGPYVGGRVLDLSKAASSALGYDGVAYVRATPVATRTVAVHSVVRPVKHK